jgi:hypothetical protein
MKRESRLLLILFLSMMPLGGCLYRSYPVRLRTSTDPLLTATRDDLIERIKDEESKIETLSATVGIVASNTGAKPGKILKEKEVVGHLTLVRDSSPQSTAVSPLLRNRLVEMVTNDPRVDLLIPSHDQFTVRDDDVVRVSVQPLAVVGLKVIYDALLLQPINRESEFAVLEQGEHEVSDPGTQKVALQPDYTLDIFKHDEQGYRLSRKTLFDRTDLQPHEEVIFDQTGSIETDVRYDEYREFNGVLFPTKIRVRRPQEEYSLEIRVIKLSINGPVADDQLVLEQTQGFRHAAQ